MIVPSHSKQSALATSPSRQAVPPHRWPLVGIAILSMVSTPGCKSEPVYQDRPQTLASLKQCRELAANKDEYTKQLEATIAEFKRSDSGQEVVIKVEGNPWTIRGITGKGPHARSKIATGSAQDKDLYEAFIKKSRVSRQKIKKCYQSALKKNSAIQARTIKLMITVSYYTDGKVKIASFAPQISPEFNTCMQSVTKLWTLPAMPKAVSFSAPLLLTPE